MIKLPIAGWLCLGWLAGASPLLAQAPKPPPAVPVATPRPAGSVVLGIKNPHLGMPGARVDAAGRGDGQAIASLYVIAPELIGSTRRAQPSLFWYQTKPARLPFEFALLQPGQAKPLLALHFPDGRRSGFQRLRLSDHGIALQPNVDYQWVIALIRDPQSRSRDIVSSGWIRRTPEAPAGEAWYDAAEKLADQIAEHPRDERLRAQQAKLLNEASLFVPAKAALAP